MISNTELHCHLNEKDTTIVVPRLIIESSQNGLYNWKPTTWLFEPFLKMINLPGEGVVEQH